MLIIAMDDSDIICCFSFRFFDKKKIEVEFCVEAKKKRFRQQDKLGNNTRLKFYF